MIIHCSQKLAAKLPAIASTPLEETSPLGSWHAHLFTLDRRQCMMFCHDATRYVLFLPGLRKNHFTELGSQWFRPLYLATLARIFGVRVSWHSVKREMLIFAPQIHPLSVEGEGRGEGESAVKCCSPLSPTPLPAGARE